MRPFLGVPLGIYLNIPLAVWFSAKKGRGISYKPSADSDCLDFASDTKIQNYVYP
jgi:hypothetical protein